MERFGIAMRPTPRQADVLIISGYLATKTLKRVIRVYEQIQDPKYIVALGSCTINGGMYFDSYNTLNVLDKYLPVDVYVMGCMPSLKQLLMALVFSCRKSRMGEHRAGVIIKKTWIITGKTRRRSSPIGIFLITTGKG